MTRKTKSETKATNPLVEAISLSGVAPMQINDVNKASIPTMFDDTGKVLKAFTGESLIKACGAEVSGKIEAEVAEENFAKLSGLPRGESISQAIMLMCAARYHGAPGDHFERTQAVESLRLAVIDAIRGEIRNKNLKAKLANWEAGASGNTSLAKECKAAEARVLNSVRVPFSRIVSMLQMPASEKYAALPGKPGSPAPVLKLPGMTDKEAITLDRPTAFEKAKKAIREYVNQPVTRAFTPATATATPSSVQPETPRATVAKDAFTQTVAATTGGKWEVATETAKLISLVTECSELASVGGKVNLNAEEAAISADAIDAIRKARDSMLKMANRLKARAASNAAAEKATSAKMAG